MLSCSIRECLVYHFGSSDPFWWILESKRLVLIKEGEDYCNRKKCTFVFALFQLLHCIMFTFTDPLSNPAMMNEQLSMRKVLVGEIKAGINADYCSRRYCSNWTFGSKL